MKKWVIVLIIIGVIGVSALIWLVNGLNRVAIMNENVKAAWAQVENQLQRRNDLIPNLVNTVKGYAAHEKTLLEEITRLRSQWAKARTTEDKIAASNEMNTVLGRLMVVVEQYPDLKANQNFLALQAQLEGTENRIAVERMRYNNTVRDFNAYIRTIFGSFFANLRGLNRPEVYFDITEEAGRVPQVKF